MQEPEIHPHMAFFSVYMGLIITYSPIMVCTPISFKRASLRYVNPAQPDQAIPMYSVDFDEPLFTAP